MKAYNFQNPEIQQKASQKARTAPRSKSYYSKTKRVQEAKQEINITTISVPIKIV